jgi:hypothetical protein
VRAVGVDTAAWSDRAEGPTGPVAWSASSATRGFSRYSWFLGV